MNGRQIILIVDDIEANLVALKETLDDVGADIITASSGNEAVIKAMELDLDLILIDVQMPGMDGFEAVSFIKKEPKNKYIPILFQTGISKEEKYIVKGLDCGAVDYITKPISSEILTAKVRQFLEMQKDKKELSELKTLLFNIINSTPDLICAKDANLTTMLCNKAYASVVGKHPSNMIGNTDVENGWHVDIVNGSRQKGIKGFLSDDIEALTGKTVHLPNDPLNIGSEDKIFDTLKLPLYDNKNSIIGLTSIARDVTELKRDEEKIKNLLREKELLLKEVELTQDVVIECIVRMGEFRNTEIGDHIIRTQAYVCALSEKLSQIDKYKDIFTLQYKRLLFKCVPLHDIGKVVIPDEILLKPGKLTPEEFEVIKKHTTEGKRILLGAEKKLGQNSFLRLAMQMAESHHERWDGKGYPGKIAGENIPLPGRLMAIADVYDALASKRVYKPPFPHEEATHLIFEGRGTQFDPEMVDVFMEIQDQFKEISEAKLDDF
ncbi:MAG: HD domain-containing phosphohydrolase [Lentisphaerota bacterium]